MTAILDRLRAVRDAVFRVAVIPILLRACVFVTVLVALVLAYSDEVLASRAVVLLVLAALLPAIGPRRIWPTLTALLAVGGWLVSTIGYGEPVVLWRLLGLAGALYLAHSFCALAAALPYDALVSPEVVVRWVLRALGPVLAAAVLSVPLLSLTERRGGSDWAVLAGLAAAVGTAVLLSRSARLGRR